MMKNTNIKFTESSDAVSAYLRSIRKYKPMTAEEEDAAFIRLREGDESAREEIINANLRFAFSKAKEASRDGNLMDLVNEANSGLVTALNKFDSTKGFRFITFAVHYIRQAISLYYYNNAYVKKSNSLKIGNSVSKISEKFYVENGRNPSTEEIKDVLEKTKGITVLDDRDLLNVSCSSIDSFFGEDDDNTFEQSSIFTNATSICNEYEKTIEEESNKSKVFSLLSKLDERSKDIVKMFFGIDYDYAYDVEEIAEKYNITPTRVGQIKNAAIAKMK